MVIWRRSPVLFLLAFALLAGCSDKAKEDVSKERLEQLAGGSLQEVVPVSGKVLIDGAPAEGVNIYLYDEAGATQLKNARTDKEGKYCWSTYTLCDGLEPGSYKLTFVHIPKPKKNGTGEDLLKRKYRNARQSEFKLTVQKGTPQTDVNYELKK